MGLDDPAALAEMASILRRSHDRRLAQASRSATRPGVEREAGHPSKPLGVPGSFPAAGDDCGTTTTDA